MKKLITITVLIIVVISIILTIYFSGKKAGKTGTFSEGAVTDDSVTIPGENQVTLTHDEESKIRVMVSKLYKDMDGLNIWGNNMDIYNDYASMSDKLFVLTYNLFNKLYESQGYGTLRDWIDDEQGLFGGIIDTINNRFDRLNLA